MTYGINPVIRDLRRDPSRGFKDRHRDSFRSFSGTEIVGGDSSVARARSEQFAVAGPMKQLIVVLPDGTIVTPRAVGRS